MKQHRLTLARQHYHALHHTLAQAIGSSRDSGECCTLPRPAPHLRSGRRVLQRHWWVLHTTTPCTTPSIRPSGPPETVVSAAHCTRVVSDAHYTRVVSAAHCTRGGGDLNCLLICSMCLLPLVLFKLQTGKHKIYLHIQWSVCSIITINGVVSAVCSVGSGTSSAGGCDPVQLKGEVAAARERLGRLKHELHRDRQSIASRQAGINTLTQWVL